MEPEKGSLLDWARQVRADTALNPTGIIKVRGTQVAQMADDLWANIMAQRALEADCEQKIRDISEMANIAAAKAEAFEHALALQSKAEIVPTPLKRKRRTLTGDVEPPNDPAGHGATDDVEAVTNGEKPPAGSKKRPKLGLFQGGKPDEPAA